ncbi:MAG: nitroreductase family protein, partial [Candidatus Aphodomorpha sp.]
FLKLAAARYSCRKYKDASIDRDCIDQILTAGLLAPTAHNNQPQRIIVVQSKEALSLLDECTVCHYHAPLAFIVCCDSTKAWTRDYDGKSSGDIDASIVATHMMLEAKELGIDSTWIMCFIPEAVKAKFELPEELVPVAILFMGYSDDTPSPSHLSRCELEACVTYR